MAKKDEKDYSKFSRRVLEDLESRLHNEIIRVRDKYQETKAKYEKELKAFKSKATREIEVFTSKVNKEVVAFENKIKKELEAIKTHSAKKTEEKQKVNEALNNLIYTQGKDNQEQESKKTDATPTNTKQEVKPTQETQEVKANSTQNQTKGQENTQAHFTNKPH
ncbi:hypothetical protein NHP21005_19990 (plasmid) [Helicobacter sp. NHP21005]|uniref:hypothetical protein n=1 Tax=Helicobacter felistomachi TaxID=3040201 RepID=UPI002573567E|nr:hypothetical protein [Helicobacter sp. NHP21005]BEG58311.1 hypothetical protein NHP21005_19990 [Helicobacter sp. NHP21005]